MKHNFANWWKKIIDDKGDSEIIAQTFSTAEQDKKLKKLLKPTSNLISALEYGQNFSNEPPPRKSLYQGTI